MSAHKQIDRICMAIVAVMLVITLIFCNGSLLGMETTAHAIGYENRIFDTSKVHTIAIVMDDWDAFLETCENEEYSPCHVIIDGETVKNVGMRAKGNTSLSSVRSMDSSRYSFKIEFDQYESGKSYHGLDKLCLNNIIQDNTYMKDYLAYTLMDDFGVNTPLCSYAYLTVNGEDWGLYLAVESIEESFLQRNYGNDYGELYKPDSMSFGGGRGNGMDFNMDFNMDLNRNGNDFMNQPEDSGDNGMPTPPGGSDSRQQPENPENPGNPDAVMHAPDSDSDSPNRSGSKDSEQPDFPDFPDSAGFDFSAMPENGEMPDFGNMEKNRKPGEPGNGMGSADVKLQYIDDEIDSYSNIFDNAKTDVTTADKQRLIRSLKALSEESNLPETVNIEEVIRYFVVHNFLCNGDSYTGEMIHNYYLYEQDGQLSMIPWDYNLAFGTFQASDASSSVNAPIDTPVSGDMSDRPMISWIFNNEEYTELYHQLFSEFINQTDFETLIDETASMISAYVEKDPTKFCTYEEFQKGVSAICDFCLLREESVQGQLNGTIPSVSDEQNADNSGFIDTSSLNLSDMGTMNHDDHGGGNGDGNGKFNVPPGMDGSDNSDHSKEFSLPDQTTTETENQNHDFHDSRDNKIPTGEFPSMDMNRNQTTPSGNDSLVLLGISTIILVAGILIAVKFKR